MKKILTVVVGAMVTCCALSVVHAEELSKKQVKEIAEKYTEAILDKDYATWSSLMANTAEVSESDFMAFYKQDLNDGTSWRALLLGVYSELKRIKILDIEENAVCLEFQSKDSIKPKGYLLILPDGKIKYDAIYVRHPIVMAGKCHGQLFRIKPFRTTGIMYETYSGGLIKIGIPMFGFDTHASASDQLKSLEKIQEWLRENCNEWDSSEPKLFLPKEFTYGWFQG